MNPPDPDPDDLNIQALAFFLPVFGRAKWITGTNAILPESFHLHFTPLGQQRMREIAECSKLFFHHMWNDPPKQNAVPAIAGALATLAAIALELNEPNFNDLHKKMLFTLAILYVRKWTHPPNPPSEPLPPKRF